MCREYRGLLVRKGRALPAQLRGLPNGGTVGRHLEPRALKLGTKGLAENDDCADTQRKNGDDEDSGQDHRQLFVYRIATFASTAPLQRLVVAADIAAAVAALEAGVARIE